MINNGDEGNYMAAVFPRVAFTFGDNREPLGVRYGVRYLNSGGLSSNLRVWRASADDLTDLTGNSCTAKEAAILATVFDSDEGTQQINGCPSPCPRTSLNFPYETQRTGVDQIGALAVNGWAYLNFLGSREQRVLGQGSRPGVGRLRDVLGCRVRQRERPGHAARSEHLPPGGAHRSVEFDESLAAFYPWPVGLGHN